MTLSKSLRGRLVLALATLFALIMIAGCDDDEVAQPNADTNAANGAIGVMSEELGRASAAGGSPPLAIGAGGMAELRDRGLSVLDIAEVARGASAQPGTTTVIPLTGTHSCAASGSIDFTGSVTVTSTFTNFSIVGGPIQAVFNSCRGASGQYQVDGTATLNVDEAITFTQVSASVFNANFTFNDAYSGNIVVTNLAAGSTHNVTFNYTLVGTFDFNIDQNTGQSTVNVATLTVTITVNNQTCTGNYTINSGGQEQVSWACSG